MKKAKIYGNENWTIGRVKPYLFGSFIEHLGRCVYEGIYEPNNKFADKNGFRQDVVKLIRALNVPIVRYPGGNFVSGYNWEDAIGPKESRKVRLDYAWKTLETNEFGIDEFMKWAQMMHIEPMIAVNLGTGSPQSAAYLVEYCNFEKGSYYSDLRRKYGSEKPYGVKYWCLGNEMDGEWQTCHLSADDYAKKALEAAKMMKWTDETIKLIACGSSNMVIDSFPSWDATVMETLYDHIDYMSMHQYYWDEGNLHDFLAAFYQMDSYIHTLKATADYVKAKRRSKKTMKFSFDEWNIWYQTENDKAAYTHAPHLLENQYSLKDAVVFGGLLNTLLNNCDRVEMASLAQLVNVIAPIMTNENGAIKQTIFYPFEMVANHAKGYVLRIVVDCDTISTKFGNAPVLHVSATADETSVVIFALNTAEEDLDCLFDLRMDNLKCVAHSIIDGNDLSAANTFDKPFAVVPRSANNVSLHNGNIAVVLPKLSYSMMIFEKTW